MWKEESYRIKADNGKVVEFSVAVFKDETGLYWKQTEEGWELYRNTGDEDYQAIWYPSLVKLRSDIYCLQEGVRHSGFVAINRSDYAVQDRWLYFNQEGKLQGDILVHGLFDVDSSGVYFYKDSDLYKAIKEATIKWNMNYYDSGIFAKEMKAKGWSNKKIKAGIEEVRKTEEATYEDGRSHEEVTAILNRTGSTEAGGWSAKVQTYAYYKVTGHWEETE